MIIWLASYPKSGNTLLRCMLGSLIYSKIFSTDGKIDFKHKDLIPQFPKSEFFEDKNKDFINIKEISKHWISAQKRINSNKLINFLKTHHLNCHVDNDAFTNKENTAGVIYIVRDPRNVFTSLKYHYSFSDDETLETMFNKNWQITPLKYQDKKQIINLVGSWNENYNSWKNKNTLIVKYEDLVFNKKEELIRIISFINQFIKLDFTESQIDKCVESSSFTNMQKMENENLFNENIIDQKTNRRKKFFNLGKENNWEKILDDNISIKIQNKFELEMKELKYL